MVCQERREIFSMACWFAERDRQEWGKIFPGLQRDERYFLSLAGLPRESTYLFIQKTFFLKKNCFFNYLIILFFKVIRVL